MNLPTRPHAIFAQCKAHKTPTQSQACKELKIPTHNPPRPASPDYLQPFAEILKLDLKEVQTKFIAYKISKDFDGIKHSTDGLKAAEQQIKKKKK